MDFEIEYKQLSEVALITSGKRPTSVVKEKSQRHWVPVIGSGGQSGFTEESLYSEEILITGRVGTLGKLFWVKEPCWPSDNSLVIRPKGDINFIFLRHILGSIIPSTVGMNRGAANPLITQTDLGKLKIPIPKKSVQVQIASVLGKLDEKIALNHQVNQTLELLAKTLLPKLLSGELAMLNKTEDRKES